MQGTPVKILQTFRRNVLQGSACCLLLSGYLLGVLVDPEDGGSKFFRNFVELLPHYMVSHSDSLHSDRCEILKSNITHLFEAGRSLDKIIRTTY
jgi:hypothetical protein